MPIRMRESGIVVRLTMASDVGRQRSGLNSTAARGADRG